MQIEIRLKQKETKRGIFWFKKVFVTGIITFITNDGNKSFPVCSNGWGNRPSDAGVYLCTRILELPNIDKYKGFKGSKRCWFANLVPQFKSKYFIKQTDIGIHPDGNVVGSQGCDVVPLDVDEEIFQLIKYGLKKGSIPVTIIHEFKE